jgi:cell division septation protein DedD
MAQTKQDSSAKSDLDEVSKVTQTKTVTKVVSPVKIAAKKNAKNVTQNKHKMASYNKNNKKQVTTPSSEKWLVRVGYHVPSEHSKSIVSSLHKIGYKNVYSKKMSINGKNVTNIFVGPMKSQKEASKTAKKISSSLHLRPAVIKSKPIPIKKSR